MNEQLVREVEGIVKNKIRNIPIAGDWQCRDRIRQYNQALSDVKEVI